MKYFSYLYVIKARFYYLVLGFLLAFLTAYEQRDILIYLLVEALPPGGSFGKEASPQMIFLKITEGFSSQISISFLAAIYGLLPLIWIQIWFFLAAGLYKEEQRLFLKIILSSLAFILLATFLTKNIILPRAWSFFLSFSMENLSYTPSWGPYLQISIEILTGILLTSQIPILIFLLIHWGWWSSDIFLRKRSYFIFGLLLWGGLITPPDIWSLLMVFLPLFFIYEFVVFLVIWKKISNY